MEITEIHFESIDSTNTYAKKHASEFPADQLTCIYAETQTAGRGRYQRSWVSPPQQNIYATFVFQLPAQTLHLGSLGQIMAVSFAHVLLKEGFHPKIKWPNDIQLNGKKVSGILCETSFLRSTVHVFLGIGINVNMEEEVLAKIDQPATSLKAETKKTWDRDAVLRKLQRQFVSDLQRFKKEGFTPFHPQFENLLAYKGETVHCFDGKKEWVGICHSLTNDGQLNLYLPNKEIHTILSGDIFLEGQTNPKNLS